VHLGQDESRAGTPAAEIGFVWAKNDTRHAVFVGIKLGSFWQKRFVFSSCSEHFNVVLTISILKL